MPASISLIHLSWSLPDTSPLFDDLNLVFGAERTGIIGRNGTGKSTLLKLIAGHLQPASGQVQRSASVALMKQDAITCPDDRIADLFGVSDALHILDQAEAGLASAEELANADWTLPMRMEAALLRSGLRAEPQTRLKSLSGGEQSRAALAALMLADPEFLLMDEPTNNLDRAGRMAVIEFIRQWKGGAIIASHDRELLEEMDNIVELTTLGATRYGGNYSAYRQLKDNEVEAAARHLAQAEKTLTEAARRAQQAAERKARKDSAGHRARTKGDQPKILMDAAKGRAEASKGTGARLREARREAADETLASARDHVEILQPLRMDIPSTTLPEGKIVLRLNGVTGGHDHAHAIIDNLSLTVTGPERIVIAGRNGSGKTTLLKLITGEIMPHRGTIERMVPFAILDQHAASPDPAKSLLENFLSQNPMADPHMAHAALARFGFRGDASLRRSADLSGGELLRAGLACAMGAVPPPMLLILDEPTNHLDLDGIAALETALKAYDGAMIVVSHDQNFIQSIAPDRILYLPG